MFGVMLTMMRVAAVCAIVVGAVYGVATLMTAFNFNSDKVYVWFKWLTFILAVIAIVVFACALIVGVLAVW